MIHSLRLLTISLAIFLFAACSPSAAPEKVSGFSSYLPISLNDQTLQLRLALSNDEQAQGLMHHDPLAQDHGMLFIFEQAAQRSFWMRNTKIPLDLGYFDAAGKLVEIHALYPFDETPVLSFSREILMALEMNQGWFKENGIQQGAQLDLQTILTAIRKRGQSPNKYPLAPTAP
jgi:hypothetical protein